MPFLQDLFEATSIMDPMAKLDNAGLKINVALHSFKCPAFKDNEDALQWLDRQSFDLVQINQVFSTNI
jgi:hypothetical protein